MKGLLSAIRYAMVIFCGSANLRMRRGHGAAMHNTPGPPPAVPGRLERTWASHDVRARGPQGVG
jgi:hypothetical protein